MLRASSLSVSQLQAFRFCVAPMMDWSDRHCRFFHRLLSKRARLYTEMVTSGAVIHGPRDRLLGFDPAEHPVAVQLGGSDPDELVKASLICADYGYDEINLNVGCPSDRVQNGRFGACLMREPDLVAECVAAMKAAVSLPVTVKCRIGVDDQDPQHALFNMTERVKAAGCDVLIVHARKAWLKGLSPKENRDVPPLDYSLVYQLKQNWPELPIIINGGIETMDAVQQHLNHVDGVMLGRTAYHHPEILLQVDPELFHESAPVRDAFEALEKLEPYIARHLEQGGALKHITRHLLGLFTGLPGARAYRRHLAIEGVREGADLSVLRKAISWLSLGPSSA
jgi:tRNA-dihydrouridine synthase A